MDTVHTPVMLREVLDFLDPKPGAIFVDATVGLGGHSQAIIERIGTEGRLIAIDRDQESLGEARRILSRQDRRIEFVYGNFSDIDVLVRQAEGRPVDGILFDLGISSFQLAKPERGFSFQEEGPLDMRLDRNKYISAQDLLNSLREEEIAHLLKDFGQERWHRRIARLIVQERMRRPIATTAQLSAIVLDAIPPRFRRHHYRIHPATRTFQAVRIAVNRELEALESSLAKAVGLLKPGGRIGVISFHSLEDRIVKLAFRSLAAHHEITLLTPKPLVPRADEVRDNPRSRSAKLRFAERK